MSTPGATVLFVYGTLKRGGSNHAQLAGQRRLGPARTGPGYTLYHLDGYPGMVRAADDHDGVTGELWEVTPAALARLDVFEGMPERLYERVALPVVFSGRTVTAETYLYLRGLEGRTRLGSLWPVDPVT